MLFEGSEKRGIGVKTEGEKGGDPLEKFKRETCHFFKELTNHNPSYPSSRCFDSSHFADSEAENTNFKHIS